MGSHSIRHTNVAKARSGYCLCCAASVGRVFVGLRRIHCYECGKIVRKYLNHGRRCQCGSCSEFQQARKSAPKS